MKRPTLLGFLTLLPTLIPFTSLADSIHISAATLEEKLRSEGQLFQVRGCLGDGAEGLAYELAMSDTPGSLQEADGFDWVSNREESFVLNCRDGSLSFEVGDRRLAMESGRGPECLYLRCAAELVSSGVTLIDLRLNGQPLGDSCWTVGPNGEEVLWIEHHGLRDGFELTGTVNLAWIAEDPGPQSLSFALGGTLGDDVDDDQNASRSWGQLKALY